MKFKRYYTALRRYNRSKGFGIHSPFAFNFVLRVLRERCPYYAYDLIDAKRWEAQRLASNMKERRHIISFKYAKMIFRVACYFSPHSILQIGTNHGVASTSLLSTNSSSRLYSYIGIGHFSDIYNSITSNFGDRISKFDDIASAINSYQSALNPGEHPFMLINSIDKGNALVIDAATKVIAANGVVIVCNINHSKVMKTAWREIKSQMQCGMSFSNDKIGIIVGLRHLPLQHYSLWF